MQKETRVQRSRLSIFSRQMQVIVGGIIKKYEAACRKYY